MHVLREVHKTLKPNGLLLDVHPQPEDPRVEVLYQDEFVPVGNIDWTNDSREIRQARRRLAGLQRAGLFVLDRRRRFEARSYYESVDTWLEHRREHGWTSVIPPQVLRDARGLMRAGGRAVVVREKVRASLFRRATPP